MEVKKPTSAKINRQGVFLAGAIPGAMLSKGVAAFVPGGNYGKLALAAVAAIGSASITGTGTGTEMAKGALAGMAVQQSVEAISGIVAPMVQDYVGGGEPSKIKDFVSKTVGLGTPSSYYEVPQMFYDQPQPALASPHGYYGLPLGV